MGKQAGLMVALMSSLWQRKENFLEVETLIKTAEDKCIRIKLSLKKIDKTQDNNPHGMCKKIYETITHLLNARTGERIKIFIDYIPFEVYFM